MIHKSLLVALCLSWPVHATTVAIHAHVAAASERNTPSPNPAPNPSPSKVCTNCNGTGKSGDGIATCVVCDGTGRNPNAAVTSKPMPSWAKVGQLYHPPGDPNGARFFYDQYGNKHYGNCQKRDSILGWKAVAPSSFIVTPTTSLQRVP